MILSNIIKSKINIFTKSINIVILILILLNLEIFVSYSLWSIISPYFFNYTEGHVFGLSSLMHQFHNYFFSINDYPFLHAAYPPIYIFLTSIFVGHFSNTFFFGRLITFISTILIALIIYKIIYNQSKDKLNAFIFAALFLSPFFVFHWAAVFRVDMLAIFFSVFGLYLYTVFQEKNSPWRYLAILFFILAFYTKQNSIAAILTILLYNLYKNKKEFIKLFFLYLIPLISIFLYFNFKTNGQFYLHLIKYPTVTPFQLSLLSNYYKDFIILTSILLIFYFVNLVKLKKFPIFSIYFAVNFILLFQISKLGSDTHYYIEPFLSLILISGLAFINFIRSNNEIHKLVAKFLLAVQVFILIPFNYLYSYSDSLPKTFFAVNNVENIETVNRYLKNARDPILSDNPGLLAISNHQVIFEPFQLFWLQKRGFWDSSKLLKDCNDKKFSLIISGVYMERIEGISNCLSKNYRLVEEINVVFYYIQPLRIYLPKS